MPPLTLFCSLSIPFSLLLYPHHPVTLSHTHSVAIWLKGTKEGAESNAVAINPAACQVDGMNEDSDEQRLRAEFFCAGAGLAKGMHYDDLRIGNQSIVTIAKDKTRNRMRTRMKSNRCIGLPEMGRAMPRKRKRASRLRVDPESRQTISWKMFCAKNSPADDLRKQWRALPRLRTKAKQRVWKGYAFSWGQCVAWYRDDFEMSYLFEWFRSLERVA